MTRVSAIITTYNVEPYIATAVQSVLDAGFDDLELILVDDGSNDATRHVAEAVATGLPNVTYVPIYFAANTIGGVASAANAGLDRATGDVVLFIDGDDWVIPGHVRAAVDQLVRTNVDFTVCGCKEFWNGSGEYTFYPEAHLWDQLGTTVGREAQRDLLLQMAPFPWRKLYRRDFLNRHNIRFPVGNYFFEDNPFHWETSTRADSFNFYRPVTHVHRMARAGQTIHAMGLKPLQIFEHARTIQAMLARNGQAETFEVRYFDWLIDHILWCMRYVSPQGINLVFDQAAASLARYPDNWFYPQLAKRPLNLVAVRQLTAAKVGDRMAFVQAATAN